MRKSTDMHAGYNDLRAQINGLKTLYNSLPKTKTQPTHPHDELPEVASLF